MRTNRIGVWVSVLGLALAGCATQKNERCQTWGGTVAGEITKRAVVQDVDYHTREVTVKDDGGEMTTVVAGPMVRNFSQIQKGDKVTLQYQESVTLMAMAGVDALPARAESLDVARAPLGEKPAGVIVRTDEALGVVLAIDRKNREVTLKGPVRTVTVQLDKHAKGLDQLKPGDKVYLRSTAALAVAVTAE